MAVALHAFRYVFYTRSLKLEFNDSATELSLSNLEGIYFAHEQYLVHTRLLSLSWVHSVSARPELVLSSTDSGSCCWNTMSASLSLVSVDSSSSLLQKWKLAQEPVQLTEAFNAMECKRADISHGPASWVRFISLNVFVASQTYTPVFKSQLAQCPDRHPLQPETRQLRRL